MRDKLEFCRVCGNRGSHVIIDKGYLYPCYICRFKCNYMKGINKFEISFNDIKETSVIQSRIEDIEFLTEDQCEYYVENLINIKN